MSGSAELTTTAKKCGLINRTSHQNVYPTGKEDRLQDKKLTYALVSEELKLKKKQIRQQKDMVYMRE